jgi:hypothetical protein
MGIAGDIAGRFPIDELFLIMSAGIFLVLCFPFDIYQLSAKGVPQPSLDSSGFSNPFDHLANLSIYIRGNFTPFVAIKYLNDFPNGLVKILLLSFPVGMTVYFLFSYYEKANHRIRQRLERVRARKNRPKSENDNRDGKANSSESRALRDESEFSDWSTSKGYRKLFDFIFSMDAVASGLLYATETFILIVLLSAGLACLFQNSASSSYPTERMLFWIFASFAMGFFTCLIHWIYRRRMRSRIKHLDDMRKATQTHDLDAFE